MILTHLVIHLLLPLLVAVQKNLSEFWIRLLPIMFIPNGSDLLVLKKLERGFVSFEDEHTCQIERTDTVRIKLFDGMIRELKDVRYVPQLQK